MQCFAQFEFFKHDYPPPSPPYHPLSFFVEGSSKYKNKPHDAGPRIQTGATLITTAPSLLTNQISAMLHRQHENFEVEKTLFTQGGGGGGGGGEVVSFEYPMTLSLQTDVREVN